MTEPLPCRCGSTDIEVVRADKMPRVWGYARCKNCGNVERGPHRSVESAIESWNACYRRGIVTKNKMMMTEFRLPDDSKGGKWIYGTFDIE